MDSGTEPTAAASESSAVVPSAAAAQPDGPPRASDTLAALDDLDFHAEFHRRYGPSAAIFDRDSLETLMASQVSLAAQRDAARGEVAAWMHRAQRATEAANSTDGLAGEVLIRRLLDDLVESGFPSTTYQRAGEPFREYIGTRLATMTETCNRLLGQLHGIPASAWAARDAAHPRPSGDDDTDGQVELFRRLMDGEDDDD